MTPPVPCVVAVAGLPGSGKSFFASRLAGRLGAEYLSSDRIRKESVAVRTYGTAEKAAVYDLLAGRAAEALARGRAVLVDATFHAVNARSRLRQALPPGTNLVFIEVTAHEALIRRRVASPRAFSEADFSVYLMIREVWEPLPEDHLTLESTDDNIDAMLASAMSYLTAHGCA